MSILNVTIDDDRTGFLPGDRLSGKASWQLGSRTDSILVRLFWHTIDEGDVDVEIVETVTFENPHEKEEKEFSFVLPHLPHSFSGKLVSLLWGLEILALPAGEAEHIDFILSPTGEELILGEKDYESQRYAGQSRIKPAADVSGPAAKNRT